MPSIGENSSRLLIDVYRTLPNWERPDFRDTARDFACGLNATIEGAHRAMKRWVAYPPSWIGERRQQQRRRFLETLETFIRQDDLSS